MSYNFLDKSGLTYFWNKIKAKIPTKTSQLTNDSGFVNSNSNVATATTLQTNIYNRSDATNIWAKIATTTITKTSSQWPERHAFLFIKGTHNSNYNQNGIIAIDATGNGQSGIVGSYNAQFMIATKDIDLSNFYIEYLNGDSETDGVVNFWVKIATNRYASWQVKILQNDGWIIKSATATTATMPTTGYTGKNAVLSGNSLKATQDSDGNTINTTYYKASNPNGYTTNTGTITGIKMNGASKGTSGVVDLGTVITDDDIINENLYIIETAIKKYIASDGTLANPDQYNLTSDYISVTANEKYTISLITEDTSIQPWCRCAWYDSDKNFISIFANQTGNYNYTATVTAPTNAAYARLSGRYLQKGHNLSKLKFERGEIATAWCLSSVDKSIFKPTVDIKEYSGIYGSANDQPGASFYFGTIRPANFYDLWKVRYRVYADVPNQNNYRQYSDVTLYGNQTEVTYKIENKMYSTNNRCYYFHNLARLNATGYNAGHSHILGIGLRSSTNPTSSSYPRTFSIEILETDGCEVTIWDAVKKIADISEYSTTNYVDISEYDGANNGLRESGDDINIWQLRRNGGNFIVSTILYRYMLCLQKNETTLIPINSVNNNTGTAKTLTTDSFNPFAQILYYNSTTTINANASVSASALYEQMTLDLRYSFNTGTTLTAHKDVYLVAVPQSNGLAKLHTSPISQVLPTTANGLIYIYLGRAYSTYQIELHPIHPIYEYKEGSLRKYSQYEDYARSLTPVAIVGSDAVNTAGWYKIASSTMSGYGNQNMLYFVKDGYMNGCTGIFELEMRSDNTSIQCWQIKWLTRHINIGEDTIRIVIDGMTWTMYFKRTQSRYGRVYFTELSNRAINGQIPTYKIIYYNSDTPEETEPETTIYSQDGSIVLRAQQDAGGNLISSTYATKSQLPTKVSQLTNDSGYTSNTGTVTSVAVKMNNTTKGTITTSGTIDLGTVITAHQDISGKENTSNKVTLISSSSTNDQYPSALAVYNYINSLNGNGVSY